MTYTRCAQILRDVIKHREQDHQKDHYCEISENETLVGKIDPENDLVYQALLAALECVERSAKEHSSS